MLPILLIAFVIHYMKGRDYFEDIDKRFMHQNNFTSFNSVQYFLRNDQKCTKKKKKKNRIFFSVTSVTPKNRGLIA